MTEQVKAVPDGSRTLTAHLVVRGAARAIDFYKHVFGAEEVMRLSGPDGQSVMHAEVRIGDSTLMLGDEMPDCGVRGPESLEGSSAFGLNVYVDDVDTVFERAVAAGATVKMPVADQFWGDRYGQIIDPFGHVWSIATHKEDVAFEELEARAAAMFSQASGAQR